jgi:hypothetical protein
MNKPIAPDNGPRGGDIPPIKREPYLGENYKVADQVLRELGIEPGPRDSKAAKIQKAISQVENGLADAQLPHVAAAIKGLDATAPAEQLRGPVKNFLNTLMERNRVASILATLGIGTTAAMYPADKSEAATSLVPGVKPEKPETDSLNPLPSRSQEAIDTALRVARNTPRAALGIGDTLSYAIPGFGEARAVKDLASIAASAPDSGAGQHTVDPRKRAEEMRQDYEKMIADQNVADAQIEDARQRRELRARDHIPIGSEAANAVPSRGYTGNEDAGRQSDEN